VSGRQELWIEISRRLIKLCRRYGSRSISDTCCTGSCGID
jgi:hypothetical protein